MERLCDRGGQLHWVSDTEVPIKDAQGRVTGIVGVARDVTEWKSTLEALRESEKRYRELFENASDVVYTTELEVRVTSLKRVEQHLLGYSQEEITGLDLWGLIDPKHWNQVKQGSLTFESEVGKGTTFFIRLPLDPGEGSKESKTA
ncbi:MAG: PAS domain S-box protein [Terriglobia bacterium]